MRGYYFITEAALSRAGNLSDVAAAVAAGVRVVQYRQKQGLTRDLVAEARQLRQLCCHIRFLVNDRVDLVLEVGADGVHLGQEDLPCPEARKMLGPGENHRRYGPHCGRSPGGPGRGRRLPGSVAHL